MAKTSTIDLLPEAEMQYFSGLQPGDRFTFSRVRRKNTLLSVKTKKGISQKSLFPEISVEWALLTAGQRTDWYESAFVSNMKAWNMFVQDYCARRANGLSGIATPSLLHQTWIGQIHIENPATEIKLIQIHPHYYYISKKVLGKKSMYTPTLVSEDLQLPFGLGFNYSANLTSVGAGSFARLIARFWYSYQGVNLYHDLIIELDFFIDWTNVYEQLDELETIVIRYDLYLHLYNVQGDLYFDNVLAEHSGQNWARDPNCNDINQGFTRNFYQIPKHWSAEIAPDGAIFESVYKDF